MQSESNAPRLILRFSARPRLELRATEFQPKKSHDGATVINCSEGKAGEGQFEWREGTQALCLCLVEYLCYPKSQLTKGVRFVFEGDNKQPAKTLDAVIAKASKANCWQLGVFGEFIDGDCRLKRYIQRRNADRRDKSRNFELVIYHEELPQESITIEVDGEKVCDIEALEELADNIKHQWHELTGNPEEITKKNAPSKPGRLSAKLATDTDTRFDERLQVRDGAESGTKRIDDSPSIVYPFRRVADAFPLFSPPKSVTPLVPSWSDHLENRVYRHPLRQKILDSLETKGIALLWGRGSCGKSVIAASLAVEWIQNSGRCFYLDFTNADTAFAFREALQTVHHVASSKSMFIVEGVHSNPELACQLIGEWLCNPNGSRLLVLGRAIPDKQDSNYQIGHLVPDSFTLEISVSDIEAIFQSVLLKFRDGSHLTPPRQTLGIWHREYHANLAGFCTAVAGQANLLRDGNWHLTSDKSKHKSWPAYLLPPSSDEELRTLTQIAALSKYGVTLPATLVPSGILKNSLQSGLVYRFTHGAGNHEHFELSLPSMGTAILDANIEYDANRAIQDVARQHPFTATMLASVFERIRRKDQAVSMLQLTLADPECFSAFINAGLQYTQVINKRFIRLAVLTADEVDRRMMAECVSLLNAVRKVPPFNFKGFLDYCRLSLPKTNQYLSSALVTEANAQIVVENFLKYPLPECASAISYLKSSHSTIGEKLATILGQSSLGERIRERVLTDPLLITVSFLKSSHSIFPPRVSERITKELLDGDNLQAIKAKLFVLTASELTNTLRLLSELGKPKLLKLFGTLLHDGLDQLDAVLGRASIHDIILFTDLAKACLPKSVHKLACLRFEKCKNVDVLSGPLRDWGHTIDFISKQSGDLLKDIAEQRLDKEKLSSLIFASNVFDLSKCLLALKKRPEMEPLSRAIIEILLHHSNDQKLHDWVWGNPLRRVTDFIYLAKMSFPDGFASTITRTLEDIPPRLLGQKLAETQFSYISVVLHFGLKESPVFFEKCKEQLKKTEFMGLFRSQTLKMPLGDIAKLLRDASEYGLYLLIGNIAEALTAPANKIGLADLALNTPLNHTQHFLQYAKSNIPSAFSTVASVLALPENKTRFLALADNCWLGELTSFMFFGKKHLPPVYQTLHEYLSNPATQQKIIKKAKQIPVHHLKSSLAFLMNVMPEFHRELSESLQS